MSIRKNHNTSFFVSRGRSESLAVMCARTHILHLMLPTLDSTGLLLPRSLALAGRGTLEVCLDDACCHIFRLSCASAALYTTRVALANLASFKGGRDTSRNTSEGNDREGNGRETNEHAGVDSMREWRCSQTMKELKFLLASNHIPYPELASCDLHRSDTPPGRNRTECAMMVDQSPYVRFRRQHYRM